MGKRKVEEVNAGSMADIAFLLLVFFLVTTTMSSEEGIIRMLPQKTPENAPKDPIVIKKKNILEIIINYNDDVLMENETIGKNELDRIKERTIEFFTNDNPSSPDNPVRVKIKKVEVEKQLKDAKKRLTELEADPEANEFAIKGVKGDIKGMEQKLAAIDVVGEYMEIDEHALVYIQNDRGTSYKLYIQVQDQIQAAINQLRNEVCRKHYGVDFTELDRENPEDLEKIDVVSTVIPQRIFEAKPRNLNN